LAYFEQRREMSYRTGFNIQTKSGRFERLLKIPNKGELREGR
jgi:hypothetical protein